jgi:PadR family transcriptional regulator, regulatory protein PadR
LGGSSSSSVAGCIDLQDSDLREFRPIATVRSMVSGPAPKPMSQMRRGAIEFCVLALLQNTDMYGFELTKRLAEADSLVTSEGTVYPLLSRIRREGLVETFWEESSQGPPRRYYRLTKDGRLALETFRSQWRTFRDAVDKILEGEATR